MRMMGLDVGDKTIGVAVSDELGITAQPITVIRRTDSIKKDCAEVKRLAEEYSVTELVIGMPLMLDGSVGIQAEKVQVFVEALKRRTNIPIIMSDERLSTSQVERVLISQDQSRAKRKQVIDKMAAAVILQTHMDKQSFKARMEREEDEW